MQISGRPLVDDRVDHKLYVKRAEHDLLRRGVVQGLNVLLVGERGSGKTSLLRQLALDLRDQNQAVVLIDGKLAEDAEGFLELIRFEVGRAPSIAQVVRQRFGQMPEARPSLNGASRLLTLIDGMKPDADGDGRIALLIDGLPSPDAAHSLFGRLRDELWQLPFSWLIAAEERDRAALMQPPANAFFDRVITLGALNEHDQATLLRLREVGLNLPGADRLFEASDGNPRKLLALVRDAFEGGDEIHHLVETARSRQRAIDHTGRPGQMLMAELEALGAASASDETLLNRLGWTRGRAAQVLKELEEAGLVDSELEKGPSGRPRRVYRPSLGTGTR